MTLTHWKPFKDLVTLQSRINRLFENDFFQDGPSRTTEMETWYPSTDIYENKDSYIFKVEVPGLSKDEVNVELENNVLTIKGEKKEEKEFKKENYHRVESYRGRFQRSFTIPDGIDNGKIKASMTNGVLELEVPKAEQKKAKAISINVQ